MENKLRINIFVQDRVNSDDSRKVLGESGPTLSVFNSGGASDINSNGGMSLAPKNILLSRYDSKKDNCAYDQFDARFGLWKSLDKPNYFPETTNPLLKFQSQNVFGINNLSTSQLYSSLRSNSSQKNFNLGHPNMSFSYSPFPYNVPGYSNPLLVNESNSNKIFGNSSSSVAADKNSLVLNASRTEQTSITKFPARSSLNTGPAHVDSSPSASSMHSDPPSKVNFNQDEWLPRSANVDLNFDFN